LNGISGSRKYDIIISNHVYYYTDYTPDSSLVLASGYHDVAND